jgi:hypothetical protein
MVLHPSSEVKNATKADLRPQEEKINISILYEKSVHNEDPLERILRETDLQSEGP